VAGNLAFIRSRVALSDEGIQTSDERPLQGQSPYVLNLDLGWSRADGSVEVSLLYNVYGRRLAEVGTSDLPDIYESTFHRVDATASFALPEDLKLKVSGTNLLDQHIEFAQGPVVVQSYAPGLTVGLSLEWSPK
jgi:outer membrane receptor protein involved in Fe transport